MTATAPPALKLILPHLYDKQREAVFNDARYAWVEACTKSGKTVDALRQALQEMPEITEISKHIMIEETKQGLNIELVDQNGSSMFPEASSIIHDSPGKSDRIDGTLAKRITCHAHRCHSDRPQCAA